MSVTNAFRLYIPHLAPWIPEKMVYAVLRNWGLGFLTKTGEDAAGNPTRAITLIKRPGRDGKRDFQSAIISFDRLFTRGAENAGNEAILQHLQGGEDVQLADGTMTFKANHVEIVYQEAGANPRFPDDPARYWKVFLYNEDHRRQLLEQKSSMSPTTQRKRPRCVFGTPKATGGAAAPTSGGAAAPTHSKRPVKAIHFSGESADPDGAHCAEPYVPTSPTTDGTAAVAAPAPDEASETDGAN